MPAQHPQPTSPNPQDGQHQHLPKRKHIKLRWLFLGAFVIAQLLVACVYVAAFWPEPHVFPRRRLCHLPF